MLKLYSLGVENVAFHSTGDLYVAFGISISPVRMRTHTKWLNVWKKLFMLSHRALVLGKPLQVDEDGPNRCACAEIYNVGSKPRVKGVRDPSHGKQGCGSKPRRSM